MEKQHQPTNEPKTLESSTAQLAEEWGVETIKLPDSQELLALRLLFAAADKDKFELSLDDIATDMLDEYSPEFHENLKVFRSDRSSPEEKEEARKRQLVLYENVKQLIIRAAQLPVEASMSEWDASRRNINTLLTNAKKTEGDNFDPLRTLGIVTINKDNQEIFTFPRNIFPKSTETKWDNYLISVSDYKRSENDYYERGLTSQDYFKQADNQRHVAHDSVAHDLKELLGLSWDIKDVRHLVAKMRDGSFPTISTGEKDRTNAALEEGMFVARAIRKHLLPDADKLPDPELHATDRHGHHHDRRRQR